MKQFKQKPLPQNLQRAHRTLLKGFRGDAASYVTRNIKRGPCKRDIELFVSRSDDIYKGTARTLNVYVAGKSWNGAPMV